MAEFREQTLGDVSDPSALIDPFPLIDPEVSVEVKRLS